MEKRGASRPVCWCVSNQLLGSSNKSHGLLNAPLVGDLSASWLAVWLLVMKKSAGSAQAHQTDRSTISRRPGRQSPLSSPIIHLALIKRMHCIDPIAEQWNGRIWILLSLPLKVMS